MWRGATAGALSTCKERQMSHFGLARALGEALALLSFGHVVPLRC
jgi:hypothetical protein